MRSERGQVVLLAAAVVVVAVVPMALAYHQLGYDEDVNRRTAPSSSPDAVAVTALSRSVDAAADAVAGTHPWNRRSVATSTVRQRLGGSLEDLRRHGSQTGVLYEVSENESAATRWAADDCPGGPDRSFGPCIADGGLVLQERAGETTLVGACLDLEVRTAKRESNLYLRIAVR